MEDLLRYIIEKTVAHPEAIEIEEEALEGGYISLRLKVHPEDMGMIIGKGGNTIRAIRNLLRVRAIKESKRVNLQLVETGTPGTFQETANNPETASPKADSEPAETTGE